MLDTTLCTYTPGIDHSTRTYLNTLTIHKLLRHLSYNNNQNKIYASKIRQHLTPQREATNCQLFRVSKCDLCISPKSDILSPKSYTFPLNIEQFIYKQYNLINMCVSIYKYMPIPQLIYRFTKLIHEAIFLSPIGSFLIVYPPCIKESQVPHKTAKLIMMPFSMLKLGMLHAYQLQCIDIHKVARRVTSFITIFYSDLSSIICFSF